MANSFCSLDALTYGSNSAVTRQSALVNFTSASDNKILGFTMFEGGFSLADNTVSATYDAFFPITGTVTLNGGKFYLTQDLVMSNSAAISGGGVFWGSGGVRSLFLSSSILSLGGSGVTVGFEAINLYLGGDLSVAGSVVFSESCKITGRNHTLTLNSGGKLWIDNNSTVTLKNVKVKGVRSGSIGFYNTNGVIACDNVTFVLDANLSLTQGKLDILGDCKLTGSYAFIYQSTVPSAINTGSSLILDKGLTFSYAPTAASRTLITMTDTSSKLVLNGATLKSTTTGLQLTKGTLVIRDLSYITSDALVLSEAIQFGDGTVANDLTIEIAPGATLDLTGGYLDYYNTDLT